MARKSKKRLMDTTQPEVTAVEGQENPFKDRAQKSYAKLGKNVLLDEIRDRVTSYLSKKQYVEHVDKLFEEERQVMFDDFDDLIPEYTKKALGEASTNVDFDGIGKDILDHFKVSRVQQTKVVYDADKLRDILPKGIASEVISTEYTITDYPGLVELMAAHGIKPKEFAPFVEPHRTVDAKEIDRLVDTGVLKTKDLMPAITVKTGKRYYRITKSRRKD